MCEYKPNLLCQRFYLHWMFSLFVSFLYRVLLCVCVCVFVCNSQSCHFVAVLFVVIYLTFFHFVLEQIRVQLYLHMDTKRTLRKCGSISFFFITHVSGVCDVTVASCFSAASWSEI
ncbi:hypothetical protein JOB18_013034 [Solea senegalensis]|uniref:Uncharacterized protein n=1 Tax=Solea senegalensis TaxID=28829 RepID=A0AAV6SYJ7_SOLSE|nr:hypothetical protein JOB18_013034 [Solea senegalensis]